VKIKKMLVATDFSPGSGDALQRAIQLAIAHRAQLSVLHVLDPKSIPWAGSVIALRHSLLGSTAAHALRELRSDVLVVRAGAPLFELP